MIKTTINKSSLVLFTLLSLSILPVINIGAYELPVLYLFMPFGMMILLFILFGWLKIPYVSKVIVFLFFLILIEILIAAFYGTISRFNEYSFPTDILQYLARLLTVLSFTVFFYKNKIDLKSCIKILLIIFNIGMLIGILQWIPWPGREYFVQLYPFRDGVLQLSHLDRTLSNIRINGIAQHGTANGGLATFFFIYAFSVFRYYGKYSGLSITLIILSIINLFAGQSRAGILSLVFSFFLFYIVDMYIKEKKIKTSIKFIILLIVISFIGLFLYKNGNPFIVKMVYRWEALFETDGGGRIDQINYFTNFFKSPMDYLFGLSKSFINQSTITYGVEIEPINIFITYGILGFVLQYSLIIYLLNYFFKIIKKSVNNKAILVLVISSFIGLFSYQIFSVAYFFFREVRIGLFPWIIMGIAIGVYEKEKGQIGGQ